MATPANLEQNPAEGLIALTVLSTWVLWLVGGLYIAGPVLGWVLAGLIARRLYLSPTLPESERPLPLPPALWAWLIGMIAMLVILLAGHSNFSLGTGQTIKSSIGWAKGWALLAIFPLAGYLLPIRMEVLARAVCRLGKQSLFILPIFLIAPFIGLPAILWISPLKVLGGSSAEYFAAVLYTIEPGMGTPRWQFFAPWSPAAGMVAIIHFLIAREEPMRVWRWTGYAASVLIILLCQSRLALVALALIMPMAIATGRIKLPSTWFMLIPFALIIGWFMPQLLEYADKLQSDFVGARADSSRVRAALGRIAIERWENEAFWFGHGIVERGPHLVEYMPIGSHHSWYGLLFVKGLAGALALAVPMIWTLIATFQMAINSRVGQTALAMVLTYWFYSFGENLEVLTYITWPALLAIGIAFRIDQERTLGQAANEPENCS